VKEIHTTIDVDADKERVWGVLTNFAAYPDWNPLLRTIATTAQPGAPIALTIAVGGRTFDVDATLLRVVSGRELRWAGPNSRLKSVVFRAEHYFILQELAPARVRLVHGELFAGLSLPLLRSWIDRRIAPAFDAMNVALKDRAEAAARR